MQKNASTFESELLILQDNMMNFAITLTMDREDAKDLLQETILRALTNKDKFYENSNFKGWVFTIMYNIFVNNYRKASRSKVFIDKTENNYFINSTKVNSPDIPDSVFVYNEIISEIEHFNDDYKIPFGMHLKGYKYEDIAKKLDLPLGTIKSRIFFARKRLQNKLKDYKFYAE